MTVRTGKKLYRIFAMMLVFVMAFLQGGVMDTNATEYSHAVDVTAIAEGDIIKAGTQIRGKYTENINFITPEKYNFEWVECDDYYYGIFDLDMLVTYYYKDDRTTGNYEWDYHIRLEPVVYGRDLKVGDVIYAFTAIYFDNSEIAGYAVCLDGEELSFYGIGGGHFYEIMSSAKLVSVENDGAHTKLNFSTDMGSDSGDNENQSQTGLTAEQLEQLRIEAWKKSDQNPDNYLPRVTVADGSEIRSTVPAHFIAGAKNMGIAAVMTTMPESEWNQALGITGAAYAHMYSYTSQCGPLMRQLFDAYAAALSENLATQITVSDIFELQTEIREKDTYRLLGIVKESKVPVDIVIGLQDELLETAKTGADFAVLVYEDGKMSVYHDVDEELATIMIHTDKTSGIYAIIHAQAGTFAGLDAE